MDQLGLDDMQAMWTYKIPGQGSHERTLSLDARIEFEHIDDAVSRRRVEDWAHEVGDLLELDEQLGARLKGVVFEVRQGYKSADSKRQNADVAAAANAYTQLYVPALVLLSTQINRAVFARYRAARWLLLTGTVSGSPVDSTYVFSREVLGYDLAAFFERNTTRLRTLLEAIVASLLTADE
jgi:hypothetical protein